MQNIYHQIQEEGGHVTSHSPTRFDVFLSVGTLKNRSFTAFGVSRSEIGIAGRNVTVTPWSGCDEITTVHTLSRM